MCTAGGKSRKNQGEKEERLVFGKPADSCVGRLGASLPWDHEKPSRRSLSPMDVAPAIGRGATFILFGSFAALCGDVEIFGQRKPG